MLFFFSAANKIRLTRALDHFDPANGDCFFSTEGALQFRYARMIARGESIPAHDPKVQWPEGVDPSRTLCLGLEHAAGWSYRFLSPVFGRPPEHVWFAFFPHVVSSLGVVAAYVAGAAVWGGALAGLLAAALYAFSLATVARAIGAFGHEDFALPFYFMAVALLLRVAAGRGGARTGAVAALLLAIALGSWHFSRFAHTLLAVALALGALSSPRAERPRILRALAWCMGGALVAAVLFPVVREPWLVLLHAKKTPGESAYGHVYALLLDKIRFLGRKPADPSLLTPDARSLWIEDFASPSTYLVVVMFGAPAIVGAFAAWRVRRAARAAGARRPETAGDVREASGALLVLAFLLLLSIVSFALVKRLLVLTGFFLSAWAGGAALAAWDEKRRRLRFAAAVLLAGVLIFEAHEILHHGRDTAATRFVRGVFPKRGELALPNWHASDEGLVDWARRHAGGGDAFVARLSTSAMLLAYADRAVVLHPKFEVPGVRGRNRAFDEALYTSEEALWRFCREHSARYYVHEARLALDRGPDSERYVGCAMRLAKTSAAFRLQFAPSVSPHFRPMYRNPAYAVFEVLDPAKVAADSAAVGQSWADGGGPLYEITKFGGQSLEGDAFDDAFDDSFTAGVLADVENAIALFSLGQSQLAAGRFPQARVTFERARTLDPVLPGLNTSLGLAIGRSGDFSAALPVCLREIEITPDLPLAWRNLGWVEANLGLLEQAAVHLRRAIELEPAGTGTRAMLAEVEAAARAQR